MNHGLVHALICGVLLTSVAPGCDDSKARVAAAASSAGPAEKGASPSPHPANTPAAPLSNVELEEVKNDKLGYSIKVPKGSVTQMADGNGGMYGKDTMVIIVEPAGVKTGSVDDVLVAVNAGDGKVEKKTVGDVFVAIVEKKDSPVNVYAGPKGAKLHSHCMAEPEQKALAIEVCSSLKATKK